MAQAIDEQTRNKVYDDLADLMIEAVERDDMPLKEIKQSAQYILDTLDTIKTESELISFLQVLGQKWKTYAVELLKFEGQRKQTADEVKIQEIQSKLSSFMTA